MNHHYRDIINRIPELPKWWDENAVPRYCDFAPNEGANIYASEIALVLIACQACEKEFKVAMSRDQYGIRTGSQISLAEQIASSALHYGDPPNACDQQCSGSTMNCLDLRVIEYWEMKNDRFEWQRDFAYEIQLPDATEDA